MFKLVRQYNDKVTEAGECMCRARMQQQMYGEVECERDKRVAEDVSMMWMVIDVT